MSDFMAGQSVTVIPRKAQTSDIHGDPIMAGGKPFSVAGALVAPGDPEASSLEWDPEGAQVDVTIYFPKGTDAVALDGADVKVNKDTYRCVGRPAVWPESAPGPRNIVWKGNRIG